MNHKIDRIIIAIVWTLVGVTLIGGHAINNDPALGAFMIAMSFIYLSAGEVWGHEAVRR